MTAELLQTTKGVHDEENQFVFSHCFGTKCKSFFYFFAPPRGDSPRLTLHTTFLDDPQLALWALEA